MKKYYVIQSDNGWVIESYLKTLKYNTSYGKLTEEHFNHLPLMCFEEKHEAKQFMKENKIDGIIHKIYYNE